MRLDARDFSDPVEAGTFLVNYTAKGNRRVELEPGTGAIQ